MILHATPFHSRCTWARGEVQHADQRKRPDVSLVAPVALRHVARARSSPRPASRFDQVDTDISFIPFVPYTLSREGGWNRSLGDPLLGSRPPPHRPRDRGGVSSTVPSTGTRGASGVVRPRAEAARLFRSCYPWSRTPTPEDRANRSTIVPQSRRGDAVTHFSHRPAAMS
jgi:hypothetical protein